MATVIIQERDTGFYLSQHGWTAEVKQAIAFASVQSAMDYCGNYRVAGKVVFFRSPAQSGADARVGPIEISPPHQAWAR